jgi:hypothetical protein
MSLELSLWRVTSGGLQKVLPSKLEREDRLEDWIERDPSVLGMELAVLGRQVRTPYGGRIDLLGIDPNGNSVILELKRDQTPRDVVGQVLDYASWVKTLGYADLDGLARQYRNQSLSEVFERTFGAGLPENVNGSHTMVVVASALDPSSERIITYLANECGVSINAVFFRFFSEDGIEHLGRAWLKDPAATIEQAESKKRVPWSGFWFLNVGEDEHRNWDDYRQYGFASAGGGEKYARAIQRLSAGDQLFAYMKGLGYVGYGVVTSEAVPLRSFLGPGGKTLLELPLQAQRARENIDSDEIGEWAVAIDWKAAVSRDQARSFKGIFANPNIACKLSDPATLEFLKREFSVAESPSELGR